MRNFVILLLSFVLFNTGVVQSLAQSQPTAMPMPANYRDYIATYLSERNHYVVRDAKITKPYEQWGGLLRGGRFSVVCVAVFRDNPLGIVVQDNWAFENDGGRVKPVELGMGSCKPLYPFPELMKALAPDPQADKFAVP
ncbi:hypothetical protein [Bradyrhizobium guangdongense]|uniref:Uncharacterized protein n=1 Tax=Bradyrhizobium guangdongense TaxID=1325090 RepID=A0A410V2W2_9BRAD|nr:hypothetical protein [Bradyrhizobium guangdongense]QAU37960.1 hypothetical protein X265_09895 [Bradyrhizobium guangdongense]QOZ59018.1 hypothetical protein XH86_09890 [Bradyrhizobium guangdongense]GGI19181.1 hypothetical protein GCM10010987_03020 [Bradyrhizobium guangdongense]